LQHLEAQEESHKEMQGLAESMTHLADQLDKLKDIPSSEELCRTISKYPEIVEEVVEFIHHWLESWLGVYLSAWDRISTEPLVQPSTFSLSLRRTGLSSYGRRWMDLGISLLQISQ